MDCRWIGQSQPLKANTSKALVKPKVVVIAPGTESVTAARLRPAQDKVRKLARATFIKPVA
jgi:hypothetical protein